MVIAAGDKWRIDHYYSIVDIRAPTCQVGERQITKVAKLFNLPGYEVHQPSRLRSLKLHGTLVRHDVFT